jgi:hypothetical protein
VARFTKALEAVTKARADMLAYYEGDTDILVKWEFDKSGTHTVTRSLKQLIVALKRKGHYFLTPTPIRRNRRSV